VKGAWGALKYGQALITCSAEHRRRAAQAEVAAVRETSVVLAALIGMIFQTERLGIRRVAVAAGIVLIRPDHSRPAANRRQAVARPGASCPGRSGGPGDPPRGRRPLRLT